MSHHQNGPRRNHLSTARPGHGTRWKINEDLSVRFIHNTVDGAEHLRAVCTRTKRTVLKLKNRPGSHLSPSTEVLNVMLELTVDDDLLTVRTVTLAETSEGSFTVTMRGKAPHPKTKAIHWETIPDDGEKPFVVAGTDIAQAKTTAQLIVERAATLASDVPVPQHDLTKVLALNS